MKYYEAKLKVEENGKKQSQSYLVYDESFTGVEKQLYEAFEGVEFEIMNINPTKAENYEIDNDSKDGIVYNVTFEITDCDEKTGKEKKSTFVMFVATDNVEKCRAKCEKLIIEPSLVSTRIKHIKETKIIDKI
jgi:hypothetical protein